MEHLLEALGLTLLCTRVIALGSGQHAKGTIWKESLRKVGNTLANEVLMMLEMSEISGKRVALRLFA